MTDTALLEQYKLGRDAMAEALLNDVLEYEIRGRRKKAETRESLVAALNDLEQLISQLESKIASSTGGRARNTGFMVRTDYRRTY